MSNNRAVATKSGGWEAPLTLWDFSRSNKNGNHVIDSLTHHPINLINYFLKCFLALFWIFSELFWICLALTLMFFDAKLKSFGTKLNFFGTKLKLFGHKVILFGTNLKYLCTKLRVLGMKLIFQLHLWATIL